MKMACFIRSAAAVAMLCGWASAASSITASPTSLSFSYQVGSTTMPTASKMTVTLPSGTSSSYIVNATAVLGSSCVPLAPPDPSPCSPALWVSVAPATGYSPLAMTVTVNPTGLAPSSYSAFIVITTTPASSTVYIPITFLVSNPPSSIQVTSPQLGTTFSKATTTSNDTFSFNYTTGDPWQGYPSAETTGELDVSSNGGTISFNVTAALASGSTKGTAMWFHVGPAGSPPTGATTSGVAIAGSYVPITVMLDQTVVSGLLPNSYGGTITITPTTAGSNSYVISVNLVVSAGGPSLSLTTPIYPTTIVQSPTVDPMITINGTNFFTTSVVTIFQPTAGSVAADGTCLNTSIPIGTPTQMSMTLLSSNIIQAILTHASPLLQNPGNLCIFVTNPVPPNNPTQQPVAATLQILSSSAMQITSITNAASFLPKATQVKPPDPASAAQSSAAPLEIVSIFGRNLGPSTPYLLSLQPLGGGQYFPPVAVDPSGNVISVTFTFTDPVSGTPISLAAPLIMVSNNQINAIVPYELWSLINTAPQVVVKVAENSATSNPYSLTLVNEDPGIFTIGGLGIGQAAVLNYDTTTQSYSINSSKNTVARGSTIVIYATGLGKLTTDPGMDGIIATDTNSVVDPVQVTIGGQPAVVSYAGSAAGSVAGLVQINAIVPPTVTPGQAVTLTVTGGSLATARRSQGSVTIGVK